MTKEEMAFWEFGSILPIIDRPCLLLYFTDESKERAEKIWVNTDWPEVKVQ